MKIKGNILYVGHCYYNNVYLSRELRKHGWIADTLNTDYNKMSAQFYHGEDYSYLNYEEMAPSYEIGFFLDSLFKYDIFHFAGSYNLKFSDTFNSITERVFGEKHLDINILKKLGKKIVYSNNGCFDGVSQTSFSKWEGEDACGICAWRNTPTICSDERNLAFGKFRNEMADYQILLGGNRVDYNDDPRVHEVPEYYCLDSEFWNPDIRIPKEYDLKLPKDVFKIYHAVGNYDMRSDPKTKKNIKCTHIYMEVIERLKKDGYKVELIFAKDIPSKDVRYYQLQADVICDMLTFGIFGANAREGMMLGKPCICYIRPSWLDSMRKDIPEYASELPIISATPDTIYSTLVSLINDRERLQKVGLESRRFALKWHSSTAGAAKFDKIYSDLINKGNDIKEWYSKYKNLISNLSYKNHFYSNKEKHSFGIDTKEEEFFVECLDTEQAYSYVEKGGSYRIVEDLNKHPIIHMEDNTIIFPPSFCSIDEDNGLLRISGKIYDSGHKVYFRAKLKEKVASIEPILSTNKYYPDNSICGFVLTTCNVKYIWYFGYSGWSGENKACVLKYREGSIEVISYDFDNNKVCVKKGS